MRRIWTVLIMAAFATAMVAAQAGRGQKEAPATVAGKWSLAVKTPHGNMTMALELKLEGKKVTGWLAAEQFGRLPLTGEYVDPKLTFAIQSDNGDLNFVGKLKDMDTLIGDMSGHAGDMPCTATRLKDK